MSGAPEEPDDAPLRPTRTRTGLAAWKWLYGPRGPMAMAIAETEEEARALIVAFQKQIDPDDPECSWLDACDLFIIELDEKRVIATA